MHRGERAKVFQGVALFGCSSVFEERQLEICTRLINQNEVEKLRKTFTVGNFNDYFVPASRLNCTSIGL